MYHQHENVAQLEILRPHEKYFSVFFFTIEFSITGEYKNQRQSEFRL